LVNSLCEVDPHIFFGFPKSLFILIDNRFCSDFCLFVDIFEVKLKFILFLLEVVEHKEISLVVGIIIFELGTTIILN